MVLQLPDLGIKMADAKAMRIFRKCDTDGGDEIDLNEFKMAMFAVDPVSGNTLGFSPSSLLSPKDAFELFDTDGTGQIDELEFADVLEYFGMDVSDAKQEAIFHKYDKDKSGYIDYKEFRAMWMRLSNVREELTKRGIDVPKYATPWKLQQMLEDVLDREEAREALVLAEAQKFLQKQRERERRELLGRKAVVRAQDELAAALDAAGQVYIFGSGKYDQFRGEPVVRDEELFPGFAAVREVWAFRVSPQPQDGSAAGVSGAPSSTQSDSKKTAASTTSTHDNAARSARRHKKKTKTEKTPGGIDEKVVQKKKRLRKLEESKPVVRDTSKFVRRRPENTRWKYQSPPKLNHQTLQALERHRANQREVDRDDGDDAERRATPAKSSDGHNEDGDDGGAEDRSDDSELDSVESVHDLAGDEGGDDTANEELAKLFFEDRAFVRSLRFRLTNVMANTGLLWARGIVHAAMSENVAFVVTSSGSVLTWGGKDNSVSWASAVKKTSVIDFGDDDGDGDENTDATKGSGGGDVDDVGPSKVTARSAMQKMATPHQVC